MVIWQSDLYHYPKTEPQWQLVICNLDGTFIYEIACSADQVNAEWLTQQLQKAAKGKLPARIQIFRPQVMGLFQVATKNLDIQLETTRRTNALKEKLQDYLPANPQGKSQDNLLGLEKPPPQALPEDIWGENWNFISMNARDLIHFASDRPIPIKSIPELLQPINLGIASDTVIPGIVVYGGRKSLILARWLDQQQPVTLNYIPTEIGKSGGLVLESGLVDRWVFATFESEAVAKAARNYEQQKQNSNRLHFLLIQPDDSGMTQTGLWLLSP
ncbi:MAG: Tab2 family RNA-binding protein [Cyanobacteria bacterium P01_F01_bin.143]